MKTKLSRYAVLLGVVLLAIALLLLSGWTKAGVDVADVAPLSPSPTPAATPAPATAAPTALAASPAAPSAAPADPTPAPTPAYSGIPGALEPLAAIEQARIERAPDALPERPQLFEGRLLVGLYGTPGARGLGILGRFSATSTVALAARQALSYQVLLTDTTVIPFFHMVTTIADPFPGGDRNYSHRVSTETIQAWIDVATAHGLWCVLDLQPGHSPITEELAYVEPFLRQRDVHLAVDPEFVMSDTTSIPGHRIGYMTGEYVNVVQAWLDDVARRSGQRKMLIIHQFDNRMFGRKNAIADYEMVDLIWDADGFGSPGSKIRDYIQYAAEPGFEYGGFKIFYRYDDPLMLPQRVLQLEPRPVFVVYQ